MPRAAPGTALLAFLGPFAFGLCLLLGTGCSSPGDERLVYAYEGPTMGTAYTVRIVRPGEAPLDDAEQKALRDLIETTVEAVNGAMSTYLADSELSRFNRSTETEPVVVSEPTFEVLSAAVELGERTRGALDVTIGPLVDAWGFGPTVTAEDLANEPDELEVLRARTGLDKLALDPSTRSVAKAEPTLSVDLSSVAKGYAVDRVLERLVERGYEDVYVEIGGETRVHGSNPEDVAWRIGIERPEPLSGSPEAGRALQRLVQLRDEAIATSGDYRNYREDAGIRLSHLIDPRTARPIGHALASVSVIRPTCLEADGLATALIVLGPDEGFELAVRDEVAALFLVRDNAGFVERPTPAFEARYMPGV